MIKQVLLMVTDNMATKDSILLKLEEIYNLTRTRGNDTWKKSAT
jgi:hypothetical protein